MGGEYIFAYPDDSYKYKHGPHPPPLVMNVPPDYIDLYVDELMQPPPPVEDDVPPDVAADIAAEFYKYMLPTMLPRMVPDPPLFDSELVVTHLVLSQPFSHPLLNGLCVLSDLGSEHLPLASDRLSTLPDLLFNHSFFRRLLYALLPRQRHRSVPSNYMIQTVPTSFTKPRVTIASIETIEDIQNHRRKSAPLTIRKPMHRKSSSAGYRRD